SHILINTKTVLCKYNELSSPLNERRKLRKFNTSTSGSPIMCEKSIAQECKFSEIEHKWKHVKQCLQRLPPKSSAIPKIVNPEKIKQQSIRKKRKCAFITKSVCNLSLGNNKKTALKHPHELNLELLRIILNIASLCLLKFLTCLFPNYPAPGFSQ
ncbi:MAG: hypothetical protein ACRDCA_16325, partial [Serratia sp. (in: enterobacteria)]|uniref:hypothetical protein n=1 Tax=Serratia sp. (in: enterobacteria) TaxID=616 RepID=UPI003F2C6D0A